MSNLANWAFLLHSLISWSIPTKWSNRKSISMLPWRVLSLLLDEFFWSTPIDAPALNPKQIVGRYLRFGSIMTGFFATIIQLELYFMTKVESFIKYSALIIFCFWLSLCFSFLSTIQYDDTMVFWSSQMKTGLQEDIVSRECIMMCHIAWKNATTFRKAFSKIYVDNDRKSLQ